MIIQRDGPMRIPGSDDTQVGRILSVHSRNSRLAANIHSQAFADLHVEDKHSPSDRMYNLYPNRCFGACL